MTTVVPHRPIRVGVITNSDLVACGVAAMLGRYPRRVAAMSTMSLRDVDVAVDLVLVDGSDPVTMVANVGALVSGGDVVVVALDWSIDPAGVVRARAAGAAGFVSMALAGDVLVDVLESAYRGEDTFVAAPAADGALKEPRAWPPPGWTARETQVVALICGGLSNTEIADELHLSINSIKTYIRSAYRKVGLTCRSQVVAWAIEQGVVPDTSSTHQRPLPWSRQAD